METRKKRTKVVVSVSALACLVVFSLSGYAGKLEPSAPPGPTMKTLDEVEPRIAISTVPFTVSRSGSYYLTGDLTLSAKDTHGVTVNVDNVTIDLKGFALNGPGKTFGSSGDGIRGIGRKQITIRNGIIRQFRGEGISCNNGTGLLVENLMVENCGSGGVHGYLHVTVRNSQCYQNDGYGILANGHLLAENNICAANSYIGIGASGVGSVIKGCIAYDNDNSGISVGAGSTVTQCSAYSNANGIYGSSGSTITACSAYLNSGIGIVVGDSCTVSNNTSSNNSTVGIQGHNRNYIRNNSVNNSPTGIKVTSTDNLIEFNLVTNCTEGLNLFGNDNLYINNRLSNPTNFVNQAGDTTDDSNIEF